MDQIETYFTNSNLRLTAPRRAVFKVLEDAHHPVALQEISRQLDTIDRTSVYRTLKLFSELGIIDTLHVGWKQQYELREPFKAHHHHIQCTKCGKLDAINTPDLEDRVTQLANDHGYTLQNHHIELHGICNNCNQMV